MRFVDYARLRYDAALREIERLKQSEFPYGHIRDALTQMEEFFHQQRNLLDKLTPKSTPAIAKNACSESLAHLFNYTPFLGFILRATNVRNAFEVYTPLLRLARQLLGHKTKLLLSSEWDYSPFVYIPQSLLRDFVLIGVPAYESSNPLLMALAGHELGHNVWSQQKFATKYDGELKNRIIDALSGPHWDDFVVYQPQATPENLNSSMYVRQSWLPALMFAARQLEEVFCDVMGLCLFSEAFLHSFAYLLSPCTPGQRYPYYPTIKSRVKFLQKAAATFGVTASPDYSDLFSDAPASTPSVTDFLVKVADSVVEELLDDVIADVRTLTSAVGVPVRSAARTAEIRRDLEMVMPANGKQSLADILNAGWECSHNENLWQNLPQIRSTDRAGILNDLILKSLEVSEFYNRTSP